jgi:hypothetical protein
MEKKGKPGKNDYLILPGIELKNPSFFRDEIYRLENNVFYFLKTVFIRVEKIGYRLVVIHNRRVRTNKCYSTLPGAKKAFSRMYKGKTWKKGIKPVWSKLYHPDSDWLGEQIRLLKKQVSGLEK